MIADRPRTPLSRQHFVSLDGIRGLAILTVALSHYSEGLGGAGYQGIIFRLLQSGWVGVDLFFVLSGYLITGILLDSKEDPHFLRNFFARRILRIFPLYYTALAIYLIAFRSIPEPGVASGHPLWFFAYGTNILTALRDWPSRFVGHFWSLAVEEQFYMVWPFVVLICTPRRLLKLSLILWAASIGSRWLLSSRFSVSPTTFYVITPLHIDALMAGAIGSMWARMSLPSFGVWSRRALPVSVAGIGIVGAAQKAYFYWEWKTWQHAIGYATLAIACLSLIGISLGARQGALVNTILGWRPLAFLGKRSYSIYIFHLWLDNFGRRAGLHPAQSGLLQGSPVAAWLLYSTVQLLLSCVIATLTWHLLEKRALALKRYFESVPKVKTLVTSAN